MSFNWYTDFIGFSYFTSVSLVSKVLLLLHIGPDMCWEIFDKGVDGL